MGNKAKYKISSSQIDGILEIVLTGEVSKEDVETLQNEIFSIIINTGAEALLVDVREIKGRFGYLEAYSRVRHYPADTPRIHTAIVDSAENADYESFHETTAYNAGLSYKWFTDIEKARSWLKDKIK
ncbi:MAG TPA: STAS/SEC14 domain-containing protein [Smithella sp.]|nr:STAS/SEC14 domain-containing protein [Smithella sp.]